jgi:hypothetical protein
MTEDLGSHLHYDEQVAVETYLLRNFRPLLSAAELALLDGGLARWWEENLERMHEWGAHARAATVAPPWQPAPFDEAHAAEARGIVERLRAVHGAAVDPARCGRCARVLRGPGATRCPWCGEGAGGGDSN